MTDKEKKQTRKTLNKELKPTLDKEELREIEPTLGDQNAVRGGGCQTQSCRFSL